MPASSSAPQTLLSNWTLGLLEVAVPNPSRRLEVLARAGVDPSVVDAVDARLPSESAFRIWEAVEEISGDPALGLHFAERVDLASVGVVGYFAFAAETIGAALRRVARSHRLLKDPGQMEFRVTDDGGVVTEMPAVGAPHWPSQYAEAAIAAYITLPRAWTKLPLVATSATFQHAAPASTVEHLRVLGCVPTFDAPVNSLTFDASTLALPLTGGDAALSRYLAVAVEAQLAALPREESLMTDVERAILAALPDGAPPIQAVARSLGMGSRTLQRRLADRGVRFQDVVDRVRRLAAARLLDDPRLTIAEVSFLLGFSDASGFQRAHRRWTGRPPRGRSERAPPS